MNRLFQVIVQFIGKKNTVTDSTDHLERFGSSYGGWFICICSMHSPVEGLVISAGVGEDVSFDIEIAERFNTQVFLIDPTERSKIYIEELFSLPPRESSGTYSNSGCQPLSSYNIDKGLFKKLRFENVALWINNSGIKLSPPNNEKYVSYYLPTHNGTKTRATLFPTFDLPKVIGMYPEFQNHISILKMDIEGCEFAVLRELLISRLRPDQIIAEFDFLREKNRIKSLVKYLNLLNNLLRAEYRLVKIEGLNHTFVKD